MNTAAIIIGLASIVMGIISVVRMTGGKKPLFYEIICKLFGWGEDK